MCGFWRACRCPCRHCPMTPAQPAGSGKTGQCNDSMLSALRPSLNTFPQVYLHFSMSTLTLRDVHSSWYEPAQGREYDQPINFFSKAMLIGAGTGTSRRKHIKQPSDISRMNLVFHWAVQSRPVSAHHLAKICSTWWRRQKGNTMKSVRTIQACDNL
jgi:hypothetical protein